MRSIAGRSELFVHGSRSALAAGLRSSNSSRQIMSDRKELIRGGVLFMSVVIRRMPGDSDDTLIRKFQRKVMNEGIIPEAKRRAFYLKPSLARKQKKEDARRAKKMWA